jgi:DNA-binding LytR/AlgR family response regulator
MKYLQTRIELKDMKLLFLDIDGVLNSKRTDVAFGTDKMIDNLDPVGLGLLYDVVHKTGCIICLTSDWRLTHDYMELGKRLHLPIMFETTHKELALRGNEIQEVIDGLKPTEYAILDDIGNEQAKMLMNHFDNLVKVNTDDGISYKDYLKLIEILE